MATDLTNEARLRDYLKRATSDLDKAQRRLGKIEEQAHEPIAIVSMACRYPGGVASPQGLWRVVADGRDAIEGFPEDRGWDLERLHDPDPDARGSSHAQEGGFLDAAGDFDPEFFGITPREALASDPQQRLLLEASWEALEGAGIVPATLRGSETGVFAGVSSQDYQSGGEIEGYGVVGTSTSIVSGRIAYTLGLEGPAITVDTACSSSLVAIHLAAQALRGGECSLALAGGATVLGSPGIFIEFSRQRGLAPDGRCKSFAEAADGTGFAEGAGVLVLERLSAAEKNGHPVLATIKGSAINQDGASNGLSAPNGPSQERVIRQALANAHLTPQDVDAVEAHGTGTTLGDPIEAGALLATYGQDREAPLRLGSIKSNIGHTQAAAGVSGVIKMVMALREGVLPKTLHIDEPSTKVDWEMGEIELLREAEPWQPNGRPRRAGVSAFGISGTNAHLILEEGSAPRTGEQEEAGATDADGVVTSVPGPLPLVLSAKSEEALAEQASRLATHLKANPRLSDIDIAYSLATVRSAFEHRAVAIGEDREQLLEALTSLGKGEQGPGALSGKATPGALAYLFTGQGSQRAGMGKELYGSDPAFTAAFDAACELFDQELEVSLKELVLGSHPQAAELLDNTAYAQPALFALQVALFEALKSRGLAPDLLCGHSIGEISAAHLAGVFSLPDAAKLVAARGKLMGALPTGGAMVAIEASEAEVTEAIAGMEAEVSIAAINGPRAVVLSGKSEPLKDIAARFSEQGAKTKALAVSHAFHSPLMEPMLEEFAEVAATLTYNQPEIPIVSGSETLSTEQLTDPAYWVAHVREPVRFADSVATLAAKGAGACIELGPDPVLTAMAATCLQDAEKPIALLPTLREGRPEAETLIGALGGAHCAGASPDWNAFFKGSAAKTVPLPTYAFQRKRYWLAASALGADASSIGQADPDHPLLGAVIEDPAGGGLILTGRISLQTHPWLADHAIAGAVLLPGTAFLDLALRAGEQTEAGRVEELTLLAPLVLAEQGSVQLRVVVSGPGEDKRREITIHSRSEAGEGEWTRHATGVLGVAPAAEPESFGAAWPPPGAEPLATEDLYERLADIGLEYGPTFQGLGAAWRDGEDIYAEASLPEGFGVGQGFGVHPALLDAALHTIGLLAAEGQTPQLPFAWGDVSLYATGATRLRVKLCRRGEEEISLAVADDDGNPVAGVGSLALRPVDASQLQAAQRTPESLMEVEWKELEKGEPVPFAEADDLSAVGAESEGAEAPRLVLWRPGPAAEADGDRAAGARVFTQKVLAQIQAWLSCAGDPEQRLAILTGGAIAIGGEGSPDLAQAALWGLLRSAQSEHPDRFLLVDSDASEASEQALGSVLAAGAEPQIALREGVALAPRLVPAVEQEGSLAVPAGPWRLDALEPGSLESLALVPAPEAEEPLGPSQVRIAVRAAGINFRDVLIALDIYPGEATIGDEGAGIVVEAGEEVTDLAPGDRVMGLFGNAFGPLAIAERALLAPIPVGWSFEQAAAMPTVFLTARYGLLSLAGLEAGEKVLIHAGAGGVGSAAIQIARHLGAEVFATASPGKWEVLREAGLDDDHIASSRDLEFENKFLEVTGGEGVDVVLNSLAGEYIDASLELLPRGGRFLEMGKADVRDAEQVAAEHPEVAYRAFDLFEAGSERFGAMLAETLSLFESGALRHSPIASLDLRRAPEAFRLLREGQNVGKVVLSVPVPLDPERTVLVTGGTGGLGSLVARRLVEGHGVRNLLLAGRRGEGAAGAVELRAELRELGAEVTVAACDVSEREQLRELLDSIPAEHPLGAVIHTAGVVEDATIEALSAEQVDRVFAPKAGGAWHLHELTAGMDLSAFVMFSSVSGVLGGPGQGNYAAANSFLDALAVDRAAAGLPATAIAWGLWQRESAMTSGLSEADLERIKRSGLEALSDEQGLALFEQALGAGSAAPVAIGLDRARLRALAGVIPPILSGFADGGAKRRSGAGASLAKKLASTPEVEREALVLELVRKEVAGVLGHGSGEAIEPERAFKDLGFDSLAAVELRNRLKSITGLPLAATAVFDHPNAAALAEFLIGEEITGHSAKAVAVKALVSDEPIAILGMACRYPGGVVSPEGLWRLVVDGRDAVEGFPDDRGWDLERLFNLDPDHPGTSYVRESGFLGDPARFDSEFFDIAPREALAMDPQQRLLLEAAWEALESGGIDPASLRGGQAGVFAGLSLQDYITGSSRGAELEGHLATGSSMSVASGRIAYTLGLEGPAITVDTACSSSLVAIHLASQALRGGECSLALAGGATVLASPGMFTEFSRQRVLAPDGRCKAFAETADGTGFSEGVGLLVLERLSDAERNGHTVLATIRGSAVNQDGASNGLTAPNGPSQERVIRQALANAHLAPGDVDAVEAHGTGTSLGDPIEAGALLATYGQDRERPLKLGSLKSNIGHTQAAAGVGGVIKTVMAMREGVLPKTLHVGEPSTKVDWEAGEIELLTEAEDWEPNGRPRRAAVSSFGISGTNAHLILEEGPAQPAPESPQKTGEDAEPSLLPGLVSLQLSAKSEDALSEQAERLAAHIEASPELEPLDVAFSLLTARSVFEHRAAAVGSSRRELLDALGSLGKGEQAPGVVRGRARTEQKPVFLFPGQGSQWQGMGVELLSSSPAFAAHLEDCERALSPHIDWSVRDVLTGAEGAASIERIEVVQPVLFAVMVSLAKLWRDFGVEPAAVVGHSQGEIAAAHIAGGLSLQDAAMLAAVRSRIISKLAGEGAMVSVALPASELEPRIERWGEQIELAAENGPSSTILSVAGEALDELLELCEEEGLRARQIPATVASHSARVEPLRDELLEAIAAIDPQAGDIPFYSTVTGGLLDGGELDADYWYSNLRRPVRFEQVTRELLAQGRRLFVEVSPHPVFALAVRETIEDALEDPARATVLETLRRDQGSPERFALSLAAAHCAGARVDWQAVFSGSGAKRVPLPTYPFQGKRYWLSTGIATGDVSAAGQTPAEHPLLGAMVEDPRGGFVLTGRLSLAAHPWLADHAAIGTVLLPGTAFVELALQAGERAGAPAIEELTLAAPLILLESGAMQLQVSVTALDEEGRCEILIHSRAEASEGAPASENEWTENASGVLSEAEPRLEPIDMESWPPEGARALVLEDAYERLAEAGLEYGPAFQGLTAAWRDGEALYAEVSLAEEQVSQAADFGLHPALLDAALHVLALDHEGGEKPALPFAWSDVSLAATGAGELRVILTRNEQGASLSLADPQGRPVGKVGRLAVRELDPARFGAAAKSSSGLLEIEWREFSPLEGGERAELRELASSEPGADQAAPTRAALELVQGWLSSEGQEGERLAILTRGAIGAGGGEAPDPAMAAAWGLLRSAQSEHPGRFTLIDTDGSDASAAAIEALLGSAAEPQIALREGVALAPRAVPVKDRGDSLVPPAGPWRLEADRRGTLESLSLQPNPRSAEPLGPSQVRIAVRSAGLNFRDVVIALGFELPGERNLGSEGAGTVLEIGTEVTDLTAGDRVMGVFADAFSPLAVAERDALLPVPKGWSFEQAAAIPSVYGTAWHGLFDLAALQAGEKVLIHAGAGGVGMAAIGLARGRGAEVFATASPAKWDVLRELGVADDHIASSRDLEFKQKFLETTGGEGVDVVLNSLAGEFVDASLALLPRGGRFMEMGKADIRDPERIAAEHPGVAYTAFSLTELDLGELQSIIAGVAALFERGELRHLPVASWDLRRAPAAFRHLREGKNIGKVVLEIPRPIDPERTVLVTGGAGGLGSLTARRLVEAHGARHLVLASRSGGKAKGAKELKAELVALGAKVKFVACDVSDRAQLQELLDKLPKKRPLGAVFHAAGVLDDATIEMLDPERIESVFAPKAVAAHHLHELTAGTDLSAFVMFSSASAVLGGPGQGNYAAANAYLDALAERRRDEGLAATSIAWGLWQRESAMSAHLSEADIERMRAAGVEALGDEQGLALLDLALGSERAAFLALDLNLATLRSHAQAGLLPPVLSGLVRASGRRASAAASSLAAKLAAAPEAEREALVTDLVRAEAASALGHDSAAAVDPEKAFRDLGFDSLAAVDLRNRLQAATGVRLASTVVFDHPTSAALARHLVAEVGGDATAQVAVKARATDEPIAILGMACRYPGGADSPERLWELAASGADAISGFPADRGWDLGRLFHPDPEKSGASYTRHGGFLEDASGFDAGFFGIGPREAAATDPQQRLLLEAAWEALEDAGIDPASLHGSEAGVFAGVASQGYGSSGAGASQAMEGYLISGTTTSVASGRIAYTLGLEGPAITVDTACSSSLVAIHLAAGALRGGECSVALAGGASIFATPGIFTEFSRQRGLAPDGRCKSFADAADGTGFAEGAGVLVLERLSDAEKNGHPVLATIRGSAVNQDGASNGLTAPNGPSQERVIRQALANARLSPQDIDAVEAHGTGTTLGDPIEAGALLATYGQDRETPLKLGSIKSNIGHTQAAAGVSGVIKMVMALREGVLPKTLHIDEPSTKVDWEAGEIELLREAEPWKPNGRPRRAGVSSFGISGTNAHLILEEGPAPAAVKDGGDPKASTGPLPLVLSAKSEEALAEQASRLAAHLRENPELSDLDIAYSLATARGSFGHRAVAIGSSREQLLDALASLSRGEQAPGALSSKATPGALAYLFTGQGSQRAGMGKELYGSDPAFTASLDLVLAELDSHLDRPLKELLFAEPGSAEAELLDNTAYAQPALFALQVALFEALKSRGLAPDLLCGHSIGEISAAHLAGVFSLPDAAKLVAARGKLMGELPEGGAMVAIEATEAEAIEAIAGMEAEVSIAAINGPKAVVLSGKSEPLKDIAARFSEQGAKTKALAVSHAFHSPLMEPMLEEFSEVAKGLDYNQPEIPIVSGAEALSPEQATDPAYWVAHVREPVRFADSVSTLAAKGAGACIELGPDPVLTAMAATCLEDNEKPIALLPTLREGRPEAETLIGALGAAHCAGASPDWNAFFAGTAAKTVPLPTYAFQRKRYWLAAEQGPGDLGAAGIGEADHPMLAATVEDPAGGGLILTGRLSLQTHPWLADHAVAGAVLLPGTAFLELALRAGEAAGAPSIEELTLQAPLVLPERGAIQIQVAVGEPDERGRCQISIHSRPQGAAEGIDAEPEWTENATGLLSPEARPQPEPFDAWPPAGAEPLAVEDLYQRLDDARFEYGPLFQGLTAAWKLGDEVYAEVSLPREHSSEAEHFAMHPALLDAAHHAIAFSAAAEPGGEGLPLPFAWSDVSLFAAGASELRVGLSAGEQGVSLRIADRQGAPVAAVGSLAVREIDPARLGASRDRGLLTVEWEAVSPEADAEKAELCRLEPDLSLGETGQVQAALRLVQRLLAEETQARLAILTRGAVATPGEAHPDPAAAAAWGLIRSAQAEHPGRFALIDTDGSDASDAALDSLLRCAAEPELALREGRALAPRVARQALDAAAGSHPAFDPERTVLVTGATGGLGSLVCRHLVEAHGVRRLLLASRRGTEAAGAGALQATLDELDVEAEIVACDTSDRNQLQELLASIPAARPLGAVIHTAAALDDATIEALEPAQIERAFAAKAHGARHLHELTAEMDLSAFVLFSSAAGSLPTPGQGSYAAANAYLDALARRRRAEGLPAVSIAWGMWERESAMTAQMGAADLARLRRAGIIALTDERGLSLFDQALDSSESSALALCFDHSVLRAQAEAGVLPPAFSGMVRAPRRRAADSGPSLASRLASVAEAEQETLVLDLVRGEVAVVLGHRTAAEVEPGKAFKEMGFDSLAAVELRNRLASGTGLRLAPTMVFDFPTPASLAEYLLAEARGGAAGGDLGIEQLTQALTALPADDPSRSKIAAQLRALAADLEDGGGADAGVADPDRLMSASDEELLEFIDAQVEAGDGPEGAIEGTGGERDGR